jgi:hypothetical protein
LDDQLKTPPIDWLGIYTEIQASGISDPVFYRSRFHLCPLSLIRAVMTKIAQHNQNSANVKSISIAHLCKAVYSFMGAGDKVEAKMFLPFPDLGGEEKSTLVKSDALSRTGITRQTAILFREATNSGLIPHSKIGAFFKYWDDIEALTVDI